MGARTGREFAQTTTKRAHGIGQKNPRYNRNGRDLYKGKKGPNRLPIWTAYSRVRGKIIAFVIGKEGNCATDLYRATKKLTGNIARIYTDGNSCYEEEFLRLGIGHLHEISLGKSETHMIESTNSSIRDNLARFNRRSKRYSKCTLMLRDTLELFFHHKNFNVNIK